ncbi:MAG: hypothetical protein L3K17_06300 [Thermoplasmata archaeon]|nr:hypothetical protein [Thermoplasmata archaeon]
MSALTHGAGCGAVLGLAIAFLLQQFGFVSLSTLSTALEILIGGLIVGLILGAVIGHLLGRRYLAAHPPAPAT